MMLYLVWGDFLSCFMMAVLLMQMMELLLEDTQFHNFAKNHRKPQEDNSLYLKLCFIFYWLANILLILNYTRYNSSGEIEVICAKRLRNLSLIYLNNSIQWRCSQWHYYFYNKIASSLKLIRQELTNLNIGNTTTKTVWTC